MPPVAETHRWTSAADFPILAREAGRAPLVYLDSGATSQKPQAGDRGAGRAPAQPQRERAPRRLPARPGGRRGLRGRAQRIAAFIGRGAAQTTIFTKNATEAINLVAYAWGRANVGPGDAVLITQMEHHANIVPWQVLCRERGASCATWRSTSVASCRWTRSTRSWRAATCGWSPSPTSRTCSARSTRSPRWPRACAPRAPCR